MVSADNDLFCKATVSFGCSFSSDILLIFSRAGVEAHKKRGLGIICLIAQKIL